MEQFEGPESQSEVKESYYPPDVADTNEQPYDNEQGNSQSSYDSYYTAVTQKEDTPLPKNAVDELNEQVEAAKEQRDGGEAELQFNRRPLRQGCTVALQLHHKNLWLGCAGHICGGASCPGTFFGGADWRNCWGEVFQIYRATGPGYVRVGDSVGLYYPRERRWFSMNQNYGRKLSCPGPPTQHYGFRHPISWNHCRGEVFQIYARGKGIGAIITNHDTLNFYYPAGRTYVQFNPRGAIRTNSCPLHLSGNRRPPTNHAFDVCHLEAVKITIRD